MTLRTFLVSSVILSFSGGLSACSTVTDSIPTVKIERKPQRIKTVQTVRYEAPKVQRAEAAMVCDNDNMRARAADRDSKNDTARLLVLEDGKRSSNIIADVEINCRDYFQNAAYITPDEQAASARPIIVDLKPTVKPQHQIIKTTAPIQAADGYFYSIKKGDTLYSIARENCSSVKDISALNRISDPNQLDINQIIRLPANKCNARN